MDVCDLSGLPEFVNSIFRGKLKLFGHTHLPITLCLKPSLVDTLGFSSLKIVLERCTEDFKLEATVLQPKIAKVEFLMSYQNNEERSFYPVKATLLCCTENFIVSGFPKV